MRALVRAVVWLSGLLAVSLAAGCAAEGPRLLWGGPDGDDDVAIAIGMPNIVADQPNSFGGWVLCLDQSGSVTIDRAEIIRRQGDIRIEAFAVRPQSPDRPMLGNAYKPLTALGFPEGKPKVTTPCDSTGHDPGKAGPYTELALQYIKSTDATAQGEGVRVSYTSHGRHKTLTIPLTVRLCAPHDTENPDCARVADWPRDPELPPARR